MVLNAAVNNISVISRRSVLLVEETGVPVNKGKFNKCILKAGVDTVMLLDIIMCWTNWILDICLVLLFQVLNTCICLTNMQNFCIFPLIDAFSKQNNKIFLWSINNLLRWLFCKKLHQNCMKNKKVKIWNSAFVGPFQLSLSFDTIKDSGNLLTFLKL